MSLDPSRPLVMGILNVTPDSFSDGGRFHRLDDAIRRAEQLIQQGADILDIGGESTRPGAEPVDEGVELDRTIPVIEAIRSRFDTPLSIDTSKPGVMAAAVTAGADMINDVNALRAPQALETAARLDVKVCLMHMQGQPRSMQQNPSYGDVVVEVRDFLLERARLCIAAGINRDRILLDPGFGFGKSLAHNLLLLKHLDVLVDTAYPVLAGISRKSMIGTITGRGTEERLAGSLAAAVLALEAGAALLRVHDVAETVDALKVWRAVNSADSSN